MLEHPGVVHLVDEIAGEQEDALGAGVLDDVEILSQGVGGALVPARSLLPRVRLEDLHASVPAVQIPRFSSTEVLGQGERRVLRQHRDVRDLGVDAVGKGEVDEAELAGERHGGDRPRLGQHGETSRSSPRQREGHDALHRTPSSTDSAAKRVGFTAPGPISGQNRTSALTRCVPSN